VRDVFMKNKVWMASGLALSLITSNLTATAVVYSRRDISARESAPNATPWGGWSIRTYCPEGSYVGGYKMRVEGQRGSKDDTALNAVYLYCYDRAGNLVDGFQPHQGHWGDWGQPANCPKGTYATAFMLKVEPPQGKGDDTGANSVKFNCSNGSVIEASGGGAWGSWTSSWVTDTGSWPSAICGVSARVEGWQGTGDDTALNDLEFTWCYL
jgi:hypothetical protein